MSKKKKKDNDIVVTCSGESLYQVTGSHFTINYTKDDGTKGILHIEAGLPQGSHTDLAQYNDMKRMVCNIKGGGQLNNDKYSSINAVFCHCH